jgi:ABC-type transport system involved in multi-copper enzyme maturation permease subunit
MRAIRLIAKTVLVEAVRRKEIYVIVLLVVASILLAGTVRFFGFQGMSKFYREVSLRVMNLATALTVIVLAARQLPREFESRTIYPLLAKPVGRTAFLAGKFVGVLLAGLFCYAIFIFLFLCGIKYLDAELNWALFAQFVYLQILALGVLASTAFMLSLLLNVDAAVTVSVLLFGLGGALSSAIDYVYDTVKDIGAFYLPGSDKLVSVGDAFMRLLNYGIPQFSLFDLSSKVIHENKWGPVDAWVLVYLTLYALFFLALYLGLSLQLFRRRAL